MMFNYMLILIYVIFQKIEIINDNKLLMKILQNIMSYPLQFKSINVDGKICDMFANINVQTIYVNPYCYSLNFTYNFTLDTDAIIDFFEVTIGERKIRGIVKEKHMAKTNYLTAISNGTKASILERTRSNEYKLSVGNIKPHETICIEYHYISILKIINQNYMFVFPTNIGPKYNSVMMGELLELSDNIISHDALDSNHNVNLNLTFESESTIQEIYSLTNPLNITKSETDSNYVYASTQTFPSNGDINIFMRVESKPVAYVGYEDMIPKYVLLTAKIDDESCLTSSLKEFIFVVDRSGSMNGNKMNNAINALINCLLLLEKQYESIPAYFNVVSFGSDFLPLYVKSKLINNYNISEAIKLIKYFNADMGGTEIYKCLKWCLDDQTMDLNNLTEIDKSEKILIFLTDGQINNESQIYNLIKPNIRIFSIGIGSDATRSFIEGIANKTNAMFRMLIDSSTINDVAIQMISNATKTYYSNIQMTINDKPIENIEKRTLYPGEYLSECFELNSLCDSCDQIKIKMTCNSHTDELTSNEIIFDLSKINISKSNIRQLDFDMIRKIYYNRLIRSNKLNMPDIIKISIDNNMMNDYTSFLMIDDLTELITNNIDIPIYDIDHDEICALDGGMDMFGGVIGGCSYTTIEVNYSILNHLELTNTFNPNDVSKAIIIRNPKFYDEINKFAEINSVGTKLLFNMMVLYYLKLMKSHKVTNHIKKLESIIQAYIDKHKLKTYGYYINQLIQYVNSPFITVYHSGGGGDY